MATFPTSNIRNVVMIGHASSGKTTLTETMLYEAGAITRRGTVAAGSTQSDYHALEQEKGHSLFTSLLHCTWRDNKINMLDTPGLDDFVGEVISSMKTADTAVLVLNARSGVEVGAELVWDYVKEYHLPAMIVINQLDHEKSDFETTLEQARNRFGNRVIPVQFPVNQGAGFNSIVDALRMVMYVFPADGGKPTKQPIPAQYLDRANAMHQALVEAAAENDEALMEKFFENGTLNESDLAKGLTEGLAHQQIFPVLCVSAERNMGSGRLMGFINDICPNPAQRPPVELEGGGSKRCDASGKTSVFIYKTINEPKVGVVSYFKVYSGVLTTGDELINASNGSVERFGQFFVSEGKNRESVNELQAGDIGCVVKLKSSHTNNTLNPKGADVQIKKIQFPNPRIRMSVAPPSKADVEKLANALHAIQEEDPTLQIDQNFELKQTLILAQGEMHLDVIKHKVESNYGVSMEFGAPKVPYRETITKQANVSYRHKKQSGGAGQFAEVHMRIEPWHEGMPNPSDLNCKSVDIEGLKWGGKLCFVWAIVGGTIDARFINAIKKGIMMKMEEGPLTGSACRDIRVSIYDGKMHDVDSNDMAFMIASTMAFKEAFHQAGPQLLEPIHLIEIKCESEFMGNVMADLQTRRGIILGMDSDDHYQVIKARVPLRELHKYSSSLRAVTQGKAKFSSEFADYQSIAPDVQQKLIADYAKTQEGVAEH
jgi:elongation factor G